MKLVAWGKTDTGRKRDHNEDSFLVEGTLGLFAVADGMGGHRGGATASRMALDVLKRNVFAAIENLSEIAARIEADRRISQGSDQEAMTSSDVDTVPVLRLHFQRGTTEPVREIGFEPTIELITPPALTVVRAAAEEASFQVFDTALSDPNLRGMGTTLTAMLYHAGGMYLVHAGDSRAYLFRNGRLEQLTEDHSWIAEQVRSGMMTEAEARESKYRHIITRSVGFEREVELDARGVPVAAGDCFLLCSDGMSNYLDNEELERLLARSWYRRAPQRLIDLANERGGDDNITVVVVYVGNDAE